MLSTCASLVDDLADVFSLGAVSVDWANLPGEKSHKLRSPGHESTMSVDSTMSTLTSPRGSESGPDEQLPNWDALSFNDLFEDDNDEDLLGYLQSATPQSENAQRDPKQKASKGPRRGVKSGTDYVGQDLEILLAQVSATSGDDSEDRVEAECDQKASKMSLRSTSVRSLRATPRKTVVQAESVSSSPNMTRTCRSQQETVLSPVDYLEDESMSGRNQKNAIQARINRQKKKEYMNSLESKVAELSKENEKLKADSSKMTLERDSLSEEVAYLKSVLFNESALAGILKNINNVGGVRLTSSFAASRKRRATELDHDYGARPASKRSRVVTKDVAASGGVCLHVDKDSTSLEFCSRCSKMANGATRETP